MEGITRLVSESLARHGFDRPLDYRRLHWSNWFRCESAHSLLSVPSKPGVFALAEEVVDLPSTTVRGSTVRAGVDAPVRPASNAVPSQTTAGGGMVNENNRGEASRRMLAVTQFFEDDDMAFVLDRMLVRHNPMRARLASGRYFVRFVVIDDESQRRSICAALNQWITNSGEKISGIGAHFASSLVPGMANLGRTAVSASAVSTAPPQPPNPLELKIGETGVRQSKLSITNLDSGAASNMHCPQPLPSGF